MATIVDNQYLLSKLAIGDVASNELYYHSGCLKSLNPNYLRIKITIMMFGRSIREGNFPVYAPSINGPYEMDIRIWSSTLFTLDVS